MAGNRKIGRGSPRTVVSAEEEYKLIVTTQN
jgi:hypothetical protein